LTLGGQRFATEAPTAPRGWLGPVRKCGNGDLRRTPLSVDEQWSEFLLMGMRLTEGVDLNRYPEAMTDILYFKINKLKDLGMIQKADGRLIVTPQGRPILNAVLRELLDA
jgi:oxygen-independent coproporphyrinogen-3 oxidase